jgi:hypothetical protein
MDSHSDLLAWIGIGGTVLGTGLAVAGVIRWRIGLVVAGVGAAIMLYAGLGLWIGNPPSYLTLSALLIVWIVAALVWSFWFPRHLPRPNVVLLSFVVEQVGWFSSEKEVWIMDVLSVWLKNEPKDHTAETAIAKNLKVDFASPGNKVGRREGDPLRWLRGRLDYSFQPTSYPSPDKLPDLDFDLGVDDRVKINLVVKAVEPDNCYLFNNDSFNNSAERGQKPEFLIPPGRHKIILNISGVGVRKRFECDFLNLGGMRHLLEGDNVREIPWQPVP